MYFALNVVQPSEMFVPVIQENPLHQTTEPMNKHHICVLLHSLSVKQSHRPNKIDFPPSPSSNLQL